MDVPGWYAFSRTQNLALHELPKLGVAATVPRLEVAGDLDGQIYFHNVRVNGILPREGGPSLGYLLAILNSLLMDWVFKLGATEHANNHFAANRQFIAPLPIRRSGDEVEVRLEEMGKSLCLASQALHRERMDFQDWLSDVIGSPVSALTGHTRLSTPEDLDSAAIISLLGRNRTLLSVDPQARGFRERLRVEHDRTIEKIGGLHEEIVRMEEVVEDLVFDLYEVGAADRALVERLVGAGSS